MSERAEKRDVIIHFDEDQQKLVSVTVPSAALRQLIAKAFPLESRLSDLADEGPDEAERRFGAGILALLDMHSLGGIGIRDYSAAVDATEEELRALERDRERGLREKADSGDADSMFALALQLYRVANEEKSLARIGEADTLITAAAAKGNAEAQQFLSDSWPVLKARAEKMYREAG
ncbi:hypothetical protein [Ralstonia chuxiongensis]|uniref:hypothetical protein n=1 Tax=Ralstonia chuxiongensis TaxID=2957504 RepID=UPI0028F57035|nr:hypothetical protein [Ralstonia chuxiongensis]CAJ0770184.1 hypothetical protein R8510_00343 [Ralstonia chuxiongensis]